MRKLLVVLAMLATVAGAHATVRIFVTGSNNPYGLEDNANAFIPTVSTVYANGVTVNGYDYADYYGNPGPLRPGGFPPADAPSGTCADPVLIPANEFAYVWLQFQNEPNGAMIDGLVITIRQCGSTAPADLYTTYYLCNNIVLFGYKRWDGAAMPPNYPGWHSNPQTLIALTAHGIQNLPYSEPWNLWDTTTDIALLGAVLAPYDNTAYEIEITDISYEWAPAPAVAGGALRFVPEPASLLLICLAGSLMRRR